MQLGFLIVIVSALFFCVMALWYVRNKKYTLESFIMKRDVSWYAAIATTVVSSLGAWILFSPAEAAVSFGIMALVGYALGSAAALWIFIWFGSHLRKRMPKGHLLTEYVRIRYGKAMNALIVAISVFYMGVFLTAELTGISLAIQLIYGIPLIVTAVIIAIGTAIYAAIGGIDATIFTDRVQHTIILPLLAITLFASIIFVGDLSIIHKEVNDINPELLNPVSIPALSFGITLIIAIVAANLFHQGYWQRVYITKTTRQMKDNFFGAGILVFFIIMAAGFFGFIALAKSDVPNPSIALFAFLQTVPAWISTLAVILAIALVMSSIDTLLNALASMFSIEVKQFKENLHPKKIMVSAQWFTVVVAAIAILIAAKGYSVLYLFLVADLVCCAAAFPTFYGLFSKTYSSKIAITSIIGGIIAGSLFFPNPSFSDGNLLHSFLIALVVPMIISLFDFKEKEFDFKRLQKVDYLDARK